MLWMISDRYIIDYLKRKKDITKFYDQSLDIYHVYASYNFSIEKQITNNQFRNDYLYEKGNLQTLELLIILNFF